MKFVIYFQTKTEVKIEGKQWDSKKVNATKTEPYEPYQFVGLFICKEHNGVRCLGTIQGYNPEMNNKLRVWLSLIYPAYTVSLIIIVAFTMFVFFNLIMSTNPSLTGNNAKKFRLDIITGVQTPVPLLVYVSLRWLFSFRLSIQVKKSSIFYCQKTINYLLI